uniref:Uncharacterized protein n=1 Tax=Anas platyrhynchos platyrhynchos TaxID=8840 RepID=A0A493ST09_ANAPP
MSPCSTWLPATRGKFGCASSGHSLLFPGMAVLSSGLQCACFQKLSVRASLSGLLSLAEPIFMRQSMCLFPSWSPFCLLAPLHSFFLPPH